MTPIAWLPPIYPRNVPFAVAVTLLVGIAIAIVIAAVDPWESAGIVLYTVCPLPFVALVPRVLWRRAYPEG